MDYCGRPHTNIINPPGTRTLTHKHAYSLTDASSWAQGADCTPQVALICESAELAEVQLLALLYFISLFLSFFLYFTISLSQLLLLTLFHSFLVAPLDLLNRWFFLSLCFIFFSSTFLLPFSLYDWLTPLPNNTLFARSQVLLALLGCPGKCLFLFSTFSVSSWKVSTQRTVVFFLSFLWPTQYCQPKLLCPWLWDWKGSGVCGAGDWYLRARHTEELISRAAVACTL